MTRQERSICSLWDRMRENFPTMRDKALMERAVKQYAKEYKDDITANDIMSALEARAND